MKEGTHCRGAGWVRPVRGQRKCQLAAAGATGTARTKSPTLDPVNIRLMRSRVKREELVHVMFPNIIKNFLWFVLIFSKEAKTCKLFFQ